MTVRTADLLVFAGAEALERYGVLVRRTSPAEDIAETFTRAGTAVYTGRGGTVRTAAQDVARIAYYGSAITTPALRLEGGRTNALSRSQEANTGWTRNAILAFGSGSVADATTAPDGTTTADLIVEDNTTAAHNIEKATGSITNSTQQAVSCSFKAKERTIALLSTINKAGTTVRSYFNLSTGAWGTIGAGHTVEAEPQGNGWYRLRVVFGASTGGSSPMVRFGMTNADNVNSYAGDGVSGLYVWGMQFETNQPSASSYIATAAGTASRSAETFYLPFQRPPQVMTGYLKFIEKGTLAASGSGLRAMHIGSATAATDPRLDVYESGGFYRVTHDNGSAEVHSTMAAAPSIGQQVELLWTLSSTGAVQLSQSIAGAAATTATASAANALATAWADGRLYINSAGSTLPGFGDYLAVKIAAGSYTLSEMREAF